MVPVTIEPWWQAILPDLTRDKKGEAIYGWLRSLGVVDSGATAGMCAVAMAICVEDVTDKTGQRHLEQLTLAGYLYTLLSCID